MSRARVKLLIILLVTVIGFNIHLYHLKYMPIKYYSDDNYTPHKLNQTKLNISDVTSLPQPVIDLVKLWKPKLTLRIFILYPSPNRSNYIQLGVLQDNLSTHQLKRIRGFKNWQIQRMAHHIIFTHVTTRTVVILTKIYKRQQFFYTAKIDLTDYQDPARAFQRFTSFKLATMNKVILVRPHPFSRFLWSHQFSKFLPCDATLARSYLHAHPNFSQVPQTIDADNFNSMIRYRDTCYNRKMPVMLWSGNLLGWYRHCDFIPHAHDIDFAIHEHLFNGQLEADLACDENFTIKHILGKREHSYEITVINDNELVIDLFVLYTNGNLTRLNVMDFGGYMNLSLIYPRVDEICTTEIREHLFYVPCNAEEIIGVEFGIEWITPIIKYNYITSPRNVKFGKHYSATEYNKLFPTKHPDCSDYNNKKKERIRNDLEERELP